jgi:hypothetical protein
MLDSDPLVDDPLDLCLGISNGFRGCPTGSTDSQFQLRWRQLDE